MKNVALFLLVITFFSCQQGLSDIKINDIGAHIEYQGQAINKAKNLDDSLRVIRSLISQYNNLDNKNNDNSNYHYYVGRLYSYIIQLAYNEGFYDPVSKVMKDSATYKSFIDSAYYSIERCISIDSNNIRGFELLTFLSFNEWALWQLKKGIIPFQGMSNRQEFDRRLNYIYNNCLRFSDVDTSKSNKIYNRIIEHTFLLLTKGLNYKYDFKNGDTNEANVITLLGGLVEVLDKNANLQIIDSSFYLSEKPKIMKQVALAKIEHIRNSSAGFFINKKIFSDISKIIGPGGDNEWIEFKDNKVIITFKRYYSSTFFYSSIQGTWIFLDDKSLSIKWDGSNTVSWIAVLDEGCPGITAFNQSETFDNIVKINVDKSSLSISATYNQSYNAGSRCGNEDRSSKSEYIFNL